MRNRRNPARNGTAPHYSRAVATAMPRDARRQASVVRLMTVRPMLDGLLLGLAIYASLHIANWPTGVRSDPAATLWDRLQITGVGVLSLTTLLAIAGLARTSRAAHQIEAGVIAASVTLSVMITAIADANFFHTGLSESSTPVIAGGLVAIVAITLERSLLAGTHRSGPMQLLAVASRAATEAPVRARRAGGPPPVALSVMPAAEVAASPSAVETPLDTPAWAPNRGEPIRIATSVAWPRRSTQPVSRTIKRLVDLTVSLTALSVLSPLMLALAILVKLESHGPALFVQTRVGQDGRTFDLLKFRSMRVDAEMGTGPIFARPNDPRCTRTGRFMRRHSLDELPQLINVLRGDMSIVGPRPERPYFVVRFSQSIPHYGERHREKAGITGWAQVNGRRGDTSIEERIEYDLYYVENWSLAFDVKIMVRTIVEILRGHNAY